MTTCSGSLDSLLHRYESEVKVLVVDDDRLSRRLVQRLIEHAGVVATGAEGPQIGTSPRGVSSASPGVSEESCPEGRAQLAFVECASANAAARAILAEEPRLVVLDQQLPDREGLELLAELRASEALARLPVLMISGDHLVLRDEAARFVAKSVLVEELAGRVRDLLRGLPPRGERHPWTGARTVAWLREHWGELSPALILSFRLELAPSRLDEALRSLRGQALRLESLASAGGALVHLAGCEWLSVGVSEDAIADALGYRPSLRLL